MAPPTATPQQPFGQRVWSTLRLCLLIATFGSILYVLGKTLWAPQIWTSPVPVLAPPAQIPLPGWQMVSAQSQQPPPTHETLTWHTKQTYQYQQQAASLTVTLYYLSGPGEVGDPLVVLNQALPQKTNSIQFQRKQHPKFGSYRVIQQQPPQLIACLTPNGQSTVDSAEFRQNRLQSAMHFESLWGWILGRRSLLDKRCLWTHMILDAPNPGLQKTARLEQAWGAWAQWWQSRIPNF